MKEITSNQAIRLWAFIQKKLFCIVFCVWVCSKLLCTTLRLFSISFFWKLIGKRKRKHQKVHRFSETVRCPQVHTWNLLWTTLVPAKSARGAVKMATTITVLKRRGTGRFPLLRTTSTWDQWGRRASYTTRTYQNTMQVKQRLFFAFYKNCEHVMSTMVH